MPDKKPIQVFIASSNELKEEREKCIFLFNKLGKVHKHLHIEAVEWEYDIAHSTYPEFKDAQKVINKELKECQLSIFIFYSRIGKYTLEEFKLAKKLKKESFIFLKKGFSPDKQHLESYGELLNFIESLNGKALPIEYSDIQSFEQKLTDNLNLFLSEKHPSVTEEALTALSQTNQDLVRRLGEKEKEIEELKEGNNLLPDASTQTNLQELIQEKETIKNELLQSEEIKNQLAKDKEALEKQLAPQIEHDSLKAKALEEVEKGNYAEAEVYLRESAKASVEETASTFFELAKIKKLQLQYTEAFHYYELAAKISPDDSLYLNNAGVMADTMGLHNKANDYYEKALIIDKENLGEEHPNISVYYNNIGLASHRKGEYNKANEYYHKSLEIAKKIYREEHPSIAACYNNIGMLYISMGEYDKAIDIINKALIIGKKIHGEEHPNIARLYTSIGSAYLSKKEYDKALDIIKKALDIGEKFHGKEHPNIALYYNNIGETYRHKKEYNKAIEYYEKALIIEKKIKGEEHPNIAAAYNNFGLAYTSMGEYDKAIEYYEKALIIDKKFYGEEHPSIAIRYNNIGGVYYGKEEYNKGVEFYEKGLAIFLKFLPSSHPRIQTLKRNIELAKEKQKNKF